jgi:hypothetical protein
MKQQLITVVNFPVAKPKWKNKLQVEVPSDEDDILDKKLAIYAEPTGCGDLLCYLKYSGRFFRCSEGRVRNCVDSFINNYKKSCQLLDEDPAHEFYEVFSLNDLYKLFPIVSSKFGDSHGYSNNSDYRAILDIKIKYFNRDQIIGTEFEKFNEPILVVEPLDEYAYPNEYFREV